MEKQETTAVFGYEPMDSNLPIIEVSKSVKSIIDSEMACLNAVAKFVTYSDADYTVVNSSGRIERMADVDAILLGTEEFDERDLENRPNLKCISRIGTGIDNIRLLKKDIDRLVVTEDIWTPKAVVEYDVRWLYRWLDYPEQTIASINDVTVGIIGSSGRIGMELGFELNGKVRGILKNDPFGLSDPLDYVLSESDILFVHIPSTPENKHYINAEFLDRCRCSMIVAPVRTNVIDFDGIRYYNIAASGYGRGRLDKIVVDCELPEDKNGLDLFQTTGHTATRIPYYYNRMIHAAVINAISKINAESSCRERT